METSWWGMIREGGRSTWEVLGHGKGMVEYWGRLRWGGGVIKERGVLGTSWGGGGGNLKGRRTTGNVLGHDKGTPEQWARLGGMIKGRQSTGHVLGGGAL